MPSDIDVDVDVGLDEDRGVDVGTLIEASLARCRLSYSYIKYDMI